MVTPNPILYLGAVASAAALSFTIIWATLPLLQLYALATPNARSSHQVPTPQGAGVAVILATITVSTAICAWTELADAASLAVPLGASVFMAAVGFADDMRSLPVLPRLMLQILSAVAVILLSPESLRITSAVPIWIERALLILLLLWFVNLVNFMDGLDLMTVAEVVPVTATLLLLGAMKIVPIPLSIVAAALCGAMIGFAPFNRPRAKVFLGDVGSLSVGLLLGWSLLQLAYHQQVVAAILLPLYYFADTTITLTRRLLRREAFWKAHRSHFYQTATDNGLTTKQVVARVFMLNWSLALLSIASIISPLLSVRLLLLAFGCVAVWICLYSFARKRN